MPAKMKTVKKKPSRKGSAKPKAKHSKKEVLKKIAKGRVKLVVGKASLPSSILKELAAKKRLSITDAKGKAVGELILADPNVVIRKESGRIKGFYSAITGKPVSPLWAQKLSLRK